MEMSCGSGQWLHEACGKDDGRQGCVACAGPATHALRLPVMSCALGMHQALQPIPAMLLAATPNLLASCNNAAPSKLHCLVLPWIAHAPCSSIAPMRLQCSGQATTSSAARPAQTDTTAHS